MATSSQTKTIQLPTEQQTKGRLGEVQALAFLQHNGLTLVERNFRCKTGEIDLIMFDRGSLVFIEVRKRASAFFGGAAASVTASKQAKLISAAHAFLRRYDKAPVCRFDVLAIDGEKVDWLKNAIEA